MQTGNIVYVTLYTKACYDNANESNPPVKLAFGQKIPFPVFAYQPTIRYTFTITPVAPLPHKGDVHQGRVFLLP
jgi:hypothetical protein